MKFHYHISAVLIAISLLPNGWAQLNVPVTYGNKQALIIGNQNYLRASLSNPINDAEAIAARLTALGFTVRTVLDARLPQIGAAVDSFTEALNENDVALFYYSGHGLQIDGDNYLIPIDFNAYTEEDARYEAYSVTRVLQKISSKRTRLNVIILDSCRDNPFLGKRGGRKGWAAMNTTAGTVIAFATAPGSTASDNPGDRNGLFTKHLLNELNKAHVGLEALFDDVRRDVYFDSQETQLPWTASSLIDDFQFNAGTTLVSQSWPSFEVPVPVDPFNRISPAEDSRRGARSAGDRIDIATLLAQANEDMHKGELTHALATLNNAIQMQASSVGAYRLRGRVEILLKNYDHAIVDLSRCIDANPDDIAALYYRSVASAAAGQYASAVKDASDIIRRAPTVGEAYFARASAYLAQGRLAEAVQDASSAIENNPDLKAAYAVRGQALQALGRVDEARRDFSRTQLAPPEVANGRQ